MRRRTVLGRMGVSVGALAGMSRVGASREPSAADERTMALSKRAVEQYSSAEPIQSAVQEHASDVVDLVRESELVDCPTLDVDGFTSTEWIDENLVPFGKLRRTNEGVSVFGTADGPSSAQTQIHYRQRVPAAFGVRGAASVFTLLVVPQTGDSYAYLKPVEQGSVDATADSIRLLHPSVDSKAVERQAADADCPFSQDVANASVHGQNDVTVNCSKGLELYACNTICYSDNGVTCDCFRFEFRCFEGNCCQVGTVGNCYPSRCLNSPQEFCYSGQQINCP